MSEVNNRHEDEIAAATPLDWILFAVSVVACIFMLIFVNEWSWVTLPFLFTYMVKSFNWL